MTTDLNVFPVSEVPTSAVPTSAAPMSGMPASGVPSGALTAWRLGGRAWVVIVVLSLLGLVSMIPIPPIFGPMLLWIVVGALGAAPLVFLPGKIAVIAAWLALPVYLLARRPDLDVRSKRRLILTGAAALAIGLATIAVSGFVRMHQLDPGFPSQLPALAAPIRVTLVTFWATQLLLLGAVAWWTGLLRYWRQIDVRCQIGLGWWVVVVSIAVAILGWATASGLNFCALLFCDG